MTPSVRRKKHRTFAENLDQAALDPEAWNDVCDGLAEMVGARGALIIPYDMDDRTAGMPHSPRLAETLTRFIETGWHRRDFRVSGFPRALSVGHVTDQDLISVEDMRRHPYYEEWLASVGLRWFAGICFKAGSKIWGAAVHGTAERGPFLSEDIEILTRMREPLALAAKRASALGNQRISSLEAAFASANRGIAVLDFAGRIGWLNARGEAILKDAELASNGRLRSLDPAVDRQLTDLVERAVGFRKDADLVLPGPVQVSTRDGRCFSVDALPMPRDFQSLLSAAAALITMYEVEPARREPARDLRAEFRLTGREIELCGHLLSGRKLAQAAALMGMSVTTARQHAKSIFSKTGTHGQAEVVALLGRFASGAPGELR